MMLHITKVLVFVVFFCSQHSESSKEDPVVNYYWRDFSGIVPTDAVPGGLDLNNKVTYIGQGFVKNHGIIPGIIYPGKKDISVPIHGATKVDTYIKILCSPYHTAFKWIPVNDDNFHIKTINKYLVRGGIENNNILNIGRISYQGEVVTGKIVTNSPDYPEKAPMFFVNKDNEKKISSYEALVYQDDVNQFDVRSN